MTISTTIISKSYDGDGSNHSFAYNFKIFADADLTVIIRSSTGTETVKTLNTHYVVTGAGVSSGGNVLFKYNTGNASDAHYSVTDQRPQSGETVVIRSELANTQTLDLVANDPFPAETLETNLDKLVRMIQQHDEELDRSLKISRTNTMTSTEFTTSATDRANKLMAFDSAGEIVVTQEIGTFKGNWAASTAYAQRDIVKDTSTNNIFIVNEAHTSSGSQPLTTNANSAKYTLIVDAASATTSQNAAAASATASANSATASANSATASASSASTATTKAAEASTSASNAATSLATFQGQYHGAASSDPTSNLDTGDLYFNTSSGVKIYTGSAWEDVKPTSSEQTNINTVAGISSAVSAVSSNSSNINAVNSNQSNINAAVSNASNINSAVSNASNINTVANANSNISALNATGVISNIGTVAGISSDVTTVAGVNATHLSNVSGVASNVALLGTSNAIADLNTLAAISSDITSLANSLEKTYTVTVANVGGNNVFVLDGSNYPAIEMFRGNTYIFNQTDATNDGHPLVFKNGSSAYEVGVTYTLNGSSATQSNYVNTTTFNAGRSSGNRQVQIEVASTAPSSGLRYYCYIHGNGMGNTITVKDSNVSLVAGSIANVNLTGGSIANVNLTGASIANVNTVAANLSGVNSFAERYRVASSAPTSSLDAGDLYYNTTTNTLNYYTGSTFQAVVAGAMTSLAVDSTPQLGGSLDVNGNAIVSASNGNIAITPNGSGKVIIDGLSHPTSDGTNGQFLKTDGGGNLSFGTVTLTTINNNADNRIITGSGSADTLEAESGLTYDGSTLTVTGAILPNVDDTHDLGSSSKQWRDIYTGDINLNNTKTRDNEVDGTRGSWTIQEGEDDLFILNRLNGKKYRFKLEEME